MNPNACLFGIEPDPLAAERAASYLQAVSTVDVEADPLPFEAPDGIDCIIYNDVLHLLRDPWALIRRHAEALSSDGMLLISAPNIEYWRLTEQRLRGTWDEAEPQHGFSMAGPREALQGVGLTQCDFPASESDGDSAQWFFGALAPVLHGLGIDPADYAVRASARHLICRVRKALAQPMILSGNMLPPVGGVSHVRVVHPIQGGGQRSERDCVGDQPGGAAHAERQLATHFHYASAIPA
jgi:SAM-dependent methyltransferase